MVNSRTALPSRVAPKSAVVAPARNAAEKPRDKTRAVAIVRSDMDNFLRRDGSDTPSFTAGYDANMPAPALKPITASNAMTFKAEMTECNSRSI
jgi:hypothetical protein